ncbi:acyl-CoA dehydratase activase-related protein [Clostridiaceae bacterium 35-E11]
MKIKVGIPRALLFYEYAPLWINFLEGLGVDVIISEKTNKQILGEGIRNTVDEACVPVKLFHGHVLDIKDKVDYLFIPRIKSLYKGEYICPKFSGLPEMIQHTIKDLPPIINTEINFFESDKHIKKTVYAVGSYFSKDKKQIIDAYKKAYAAYKKHKEQVQDPNNVINRYSKFSHKKRIMLMGHPYNLYDPYMNMDLLDKLKALEIEVITPESLDHNNIDCYAKQFEGQLYWTFARKLIGTTLYLLDKKNVDGIIYISCFGCGVDSVVADIVEKWVRRKSNIPFMLLTLDEHHADGGMNTRIEAFVDMAKWRGKSENNISAHG